MGLISIFIKRGKFGTRDTGKTPCEDEGIDASTSQGTPEVARKLLEAKREETPKVARKLLEAKREAWDRFSLDRKSVV